MNRKILKKKLRDRDLIFASWTSIGSMQISELLLESNIDCLGIDLEHSSISQEQSLNIIASCNRKNKSCLPRVASHNPESIRRLLDSGADGIILPNVENSEDVNNLIGWSKYPPMGKRGYGISRAQNYGHNFDQYINNWNNDSILLVQIESINAVKNIKTIIQNENIDGVIIGPYDISGSLGIPGQINHASVMDASLKVIEACSKFKKSCGIHIPTISEEKINEQISYGFNFIILSSDVFILRDWGQAVKKLTEVCQTQKKK